ncbi:MAG: AAA family ATPase, partial [Thermodesulfobacteriota bacterium]|nr:AAA family ATPase [Thermodesulfobacteriota bacterium]
MIPAIQKIRPEEFRYLTYFGLENNPFPIAPDVTNFYLSSEIDSIISEIVHGIMAREGFLVLTGEVGLGKTTISRFIINILDKLNVRTSLVFHTSLHDVELLREINRDFGLEEEELLLGSQLKILNDFLLEQYKQDKNCAIIIDDAQNLDNKTLELIRMISNLETDNEKLVQILLIGQPELSKKLQSYELRQLRSRIIIQKEVRPLNGEELKDYVYFKLNAAGSQGKISIKNSAIRQIYRITGGNLRKVNILMDRCLYTACLYDITEIVRRIVLEAKSDLDLTGKRAGGRRHLVILLSILFFLACFFFSNGLAYFHLPEEKKDLYLQTKVKKEKDSIEAEIPAGLDRYLKNGIQKSISTFLEANNLSQYKIPFMEAMRKGKFYDLAELTFRETGYRLIILERLNDNLRRR